MGGFGATPFVVVDCFARGIFLLLSTIVVLVPLVPAAMAAAVAKTSAIVGACCPAALPVGDCSDI